MDERNLDKALEIYSAMITGKEVSLHNKEMKDLY